MEENTRPLRPRLLDILARGWSATQLVAASLGEADLNREGVGADWSFKDLLSHLSAWQLESAALLRAAPTGQPPQVEDETAFNEARLAATRTMPWSDVLQEHTHAYEALMEAVEASDEADLADPARFPWRNGRALWLSVLGNGYLHPIEHLAGFLIERGDLAGASNIQRQSVETMDALFDDTPEGANGVYNLGCFYAKTGQRAAALASLREALARNPALRDWAPQDGDLVSLHDDPEFLALVADEATVKE